MNKWLTIVGVGEDGHEGLSVRARTAISDAQHVIGSDRLLALLPAFKGKSHHWPQPFSAIVAHLKPLRGEKTVLLATGDPMNYGVTRKILEFIPFEEMTVIPNLSAFTLAAARMGWSLPDCDCFTIHGRPAANLEGYVQPAARLLVLTEDGSSIAECARRLVARGFGDSQMTVLENMGSTREAMTSFTAKTMPHCEWSPLNTLAISCVAGRNARVLSRAGGLPDDSFTHDGQLTKREVRAATLAALSPAPDQLLWDVGAGCGSVGIEWMRLARGSEAIAIEPNPERRAMIAQNADALGTPRIRIVAGEAPAALADLPPPHAVFIGGGLTDAGVFETCYAALRPSGMCVANTVTLEGERTVIDLFGRHGGELVRMDVSTVAEVGSLHALRPRMSVLQWRVRKPA